MSRTISERISMWTSIRLRLQCVIASRLLNRKCPPISGHVELIVINLMQPSRIVYAIYTQAKPSCLFGKSSGIPAKHTAIQSTHA